MGWSDPGRAVQGWTYGRRFVVFQLSKYAWGAGVVSFVGTLFVFVRGGLVPGAAAALATSLVFGLAAVMTNQYRCTNARCRTLLIFAHGSSASGGPSTRCDRCPSCGTSFT